ncbi:MAG: septation protein IspZ [Prolixibacteraceae bacterium]|jgi:isopentenyldiphosphate isomerase/intracellular septation protein A|nr:septation protein IspZ [Prolixibacteraceae bacterium]
MNRAELIKKLLPGFIPLFVFIAADEIGGTTVGLVAALVTGIAELTWIGFREKRFDKFVLFDTFLLVALGGVSILLDNDLFFKLKPGLIELILCTILAVSAFSPHDIVGLMTRRYMKDFSMNDLQLKQLRNSMKFMFFVFLGHTLLVFYSAFYLSKEAWVFISGGLFYILFSLIFLIELLRQKQKRKEIQEEEEWLPLVDEQGKIVGRASRSQCHQGKKLLHPVVHLHLLNKNKAIFLQKRPMNKLVQPGKWDTAVGGHISFGEKLEDALKREAWEEIGLRDFSARLIKTYKWETEIEVELIYVFVSYDFKNINIHSEEVEEGRFWTRNQIEKNLRSDVFTPNFEHEYRILKEII